MKTKKSILTCVLILMFSIGLSGCIHFSMSPKKIIVIDIDLITNSFMLKLTQVTKKYGGKNPTTKEKEETKILIMKMINTTLEDLRRKNVFVSTDELKNMLEKNLEEDIKKEISKKKQEIKEERQFDEKYEITYFT